jgi:hypothetical protein
MTRAKTFATAIIAAAAALAAPGLAAAQAGPSPDDAGRSQEQRGSTYNQDEIVKAASDFFGATSSGVGKVVERVFAEQGQPVGYIQGEEYAGALGVGLRYGKGTLIMKSGERREVYWQGPSIGLDSGGNASRVFTLVYNLQNPDGLYRRYPGVEGAAFFVAGISVTYQRAEGVTLAPMRTGVGLRAGVNAGYSAYSRKRRWFPL